ncbi:MAG TPA: hypothetical protein VM865_08665 [Acidobacteriaceae bacterium]|nr:hypothetical protein [Acidobacteriaceae bacterium]
MVRRLDDQLAWGYLPHDLSAPAGQVELIDPSARVTPIPLDAIKWIAFVRDFNPSDLTSPERLDRRRFAARPRAEGLWLRLHLRDGDVLEGLAQVSLSLLDTLADVGGLFLIPPDPRGNTQRLFIPRHAIEHLEPLGLILPPGAKAASTSPKPGHRTPIGQAALFDDDPPR